MLELLLVDDRPDGDIGVLRIADLERARTLDELVDEGVVHALVDDDAVDGHADLSLMRPLAKRRRLRSRVDVGIVEYDEGRVAAELETRALDVLAGNFPDVLANWCRAGE